jgi:hypothetical protein
MLNIFGKTLLLSTLSAIFMVAGAAAVRAEPVSVAVTAGTGGAGAEIALKKPIAGGAISVRAAAEGLTYSDHATYDNIRYSGDLKLQDTGLYLDYQPSRAVGLAVVVGFQSSLRRLGLLGTPATSFVINGVTYSPAQVGVLKGEVRLTKVTPYLGLSLRKHLTDHMFVKADFGAAFGSQPRTSLTASGAGVSLIDLQAEAAKVSREASHFKTYPLATIGLGYEF